MKKHLTENPPRSNLCRMLAIPQNRVFFGFVVRFRLKNNWVIAQSELRAVLVEKLEAGSGKNNVGNARHCFSQGFECYNLSTAFNLTRLRFKRFTSQIQEIQRIKNMYIPRKYGGDTGRCKAKARL
jgi:hypothetical protein